MILDWKNESMAVSVAAISLSSYTSDDGQWEVLQENGEC